LKKLLFIFLLGYHFNVTEVSLAQAEIEIGDGLPDIRLTGKCLEALKQAGFEVTASYCSLFLNLFLLLAQVSTYLFILHKGHMGERSYCGLTCPLVLAFG
jgi:hypothetical protein